MPVGSHTTGCDALWAGVPMLTCPGRRSRAASARAFSTRPGCRRSSLRRSTTTATRLAELAAAPETLRDYREYLDRTRDGNPLFDTRGFARDWEALLERAYAGTLAAR